MFSSGAIATSNGDFEAVSYMTAGAVDVGSYPNVIKGWSVHAGASSWFGTFGSFFGPVDPPLDQASDSTLDLNCLFIYKDLALSNGLFIGGITARLYSGGEDWATLKMTGKFSDNPNTVVTKTEDISDFSNSGIEYPTTGLATIGQKAVSYDFIEDEQYEIELSGDE